MSDGQTLTAGDLGLASTEASVPAMTFENYFDLPLTEARERLVEDFERLAIEKRLQIRLATSAAAASLAFIARVCSKKWQNWTFGCNVARAFRWERRDYRIAPFPGFSHVQPSPFATQFASPQPSS